MMHEGVALAVIQFAAEPSLFLVSKLYFDGSHTVDWRSPPYVVFLIQRRIQHALSQLNFLNSLRMLSLESMFTLENLPAMNVMGMYLNDTGLQSDDDDHDFDNVE
jgi:hypothetical protein